MPLTLHHLGLSQSERIIWLAEELGLDYNFVRHKRDPLFSPQSIKDLHRAGTAPVMEDNPSPVTRSKVVLAESGAIMDYLIAVYGKGRLAYTPEDGANYPHYLEWYHFANGSLQPALHRVLMSRGLGSDPSSRRADGTMRKWEHLLSMMEARLGQTEAYLAGGGLTAADVMTVFTLTTMRGFCPVEFDEVKHRNILAYLKRVGQRPAYRRAMKRCEGDEFAPLLGAKVEFFDIMKR